MAVIKEDNPMIALPAIQQGINLAKNKGYMAIIGRNVCDLSYFISG